MTTSFKLGDPKCQISGRDSDCSSCDSNIEEVYGQEVERHEIDEVMSTPLFRRGSILVVSAAASLSFYVLLSKCVPIDQDYHTWL